MTQPLRIRAQDVGAALDIALARLGDTAMIQSVTTLKDGVEITVIEAPADAAAEPLAAPFRTARADTAPPADLFRHQRLFLAPVSGVDLADAALFFGRELAVHQARPVTILASAFDCPRSLPDRAEAAGIDVALCEGMPLTPAPDRAELCLLPGHARGAARATALMVYQAAPVILIVPTGLRRVRLLSEAAHWRDLNPVAAFLTAPEAPVEDADRTALRLAGLACAGTVDIDRPRAAFLPGRDAPAGKKAS